MKRINKLDAKNYKHIKGAQANFSSGQIVINSILSLEHCTLNIVVPTPNNSIIIISESGIISFKDLMLWNSDDAKSKLDETEICPFIFQ